MMIEELRENLELILEKELKDQNIASEVTFTCSLDNNRRQLEYPNSEILIELFEKIKTEKKLKSFFIDFLKFKVTNELEKISTKDNKWLPIGVSHLCFFTLVELGYKDDALNSLEQRPSFVQGISIFLNWFIDDNYFDSKQLKRISTFNAFKDNLAIKDKILQKRFNILKQQTRNINIEINQDKKQVSEKIKHFGLNANYNRLLDCIDSFLFTDIPEPVNAGMINNLRTFMADLTKDIAHKIAEHEKEKIPITKESEMGNIRNYLKRKLDLTDNEDKFIDSFVDILHSKGGHSFMSEKEYFRLSRNIGIEIALFILSKYGKKYQKKN
jgi:hypothetical protein